jgi:hypothetical protein
LNNDDIVQVDFTIKDRVDLNLIVNLTSFCHGGISHGLNYLVNFFLKVYFDIYVQVEIRNHEEQMNEHELEVFRDDVVELVVSLNVKVAHDRHVEYLKEDEADEYEVGEPVAPHDLPDLLRN